jgi:electron-transferring-flavoprotein dehydrogenase
MKQLAERHNIDLSVALIEKGPYVGAHILSGNVFQPKALDELLPNWQEEGV